MLAVVEGKGIVQRVVAAQLASKSRAGRVDFQGQARREHIASIRQGLFDRLGVSGSGWGSTKVARHPRNSARAGNGGRPT